MNAKHTPGPWHEGNEDFCSENHFIVSGGEYLQLATIHAKANKKETEANAHLISAAPDLLEACRLSLEMIKKRFPAEHGMEDVGMAWGACEKAIAKSEGK